MVTVQDVDILPTPERMAKGDLKAWRNTGKADSYFVTDKMRDDKIIDVYQWKACNFFRLCYEAAVADVSMKTMKYDEPIKLSGDYQDAINERITNADYYRQILRRMPRKELAVCRMVVLGNYTLDGVRERARVSHAVAKDTFESGLTWLEYFFDLR